MANSSLMRRTSPPLAWTSWLMRSVRRAWADMPAFSKGNWWPGALSRGPYVV